MRLFDVHCHLTSEAFSDDLDAVLARARDTGLAALICVGETPEDNRRVLALARREPDVLAALGHYPEQPGAPEAAAEETETLIRAHRDELVAIGEVGIDHWLAKEPEERERQHALFVRFIRLSVELDLPLSVHSRSAGHHAIRLLLEHGARRVCLHAFDGKARYAEAAVEAGFYFSIPPSIVRSPQKQKLVRALPLSHLLLESDAPVLAPERGDRNEPANVLRSAETIASIAGRPQEEVVEACAHNTLALFGPRVLGGADTKDTTR